MAKRALGKGLDSIIPGTVVKKDVEKDSVVNINITKLVPNKEQPRKTFSEDHLQELADSISQQGMLVPLIAVKKSDYYMIVCGERRWRAAMKLGLKEIPVILRNLSEREIVEIGLIDNIQRESLNPIEEALGYKKLIEELGIKQDEVAERVSKSRVVITNSMRLLKLCDEVQQMIIDKKISVGKARAILSIEKPEEQVEIAEKIFDEGLSTREVEKLVKNLHAPKTKKEIRETHSGIEIVYQNITEKLEAYLATKVSITVKNNGAGKVEMNFYSHDDFERLLEIIMQKEEK